MSRALFLLARGRCMSSGRRRSLLIYPSIVDAGGKVNVGQVVMDQLRVTNESDAIREERTRHSNLIQRMSQYKKSDSKVELKNGFASVGVCPSVISSLESRFKVIEPTLTQLAVIPAVLSSSDVLLKDATGTGKTLGLLVAVLSKKTKNILFVFPTNHLAVQTSLWMQSLVPELSDASRMQCLTALGTFQHQSKQLALNPSIVIGTPSRILHLIESGALKTEHFTTLVLDEIDRMVPFARAIDPLTRKRNKKIHTQPCEDLVTRLLVSQQHVATKKEDVWVPDGSPAPPRIQVIACSATLNARIRGDLKNTRKWLVDPVVIDTAKDALSQVKHFCIVLANDGSIHDLAASNVVTYTSPGMEKEYDSTVMKKEKKGVKKTGDVKALEPLLRVVCKLAKDVERGLVFSDSMMSVEKIASTLAEFGVRSSRFWIKQESHEASTPLDPDDSYHNPPSTDNNVSDPPPKQQPLLDLTKSLFKKNVKLVCLEESNSRGLDIQGCTHVFITNTPATSASYLHMSGRTGRFGSKGSVFTVIHEKESSRMRGIYGQLGITWDAFFE